MRRQLVLYLLSAILMMSAGCAIQPAANEELPVLPEQWHRVPQHTANSAAPALVEASAAENKAGTALWWARFGTPELTAAVEQALSGNLDIAASAARLEQAWALARMVGASRWPEVSAGLDALHEGRPGGQAQITGSRFALGLTASYEADLWGRLRAERESVVFTALAGEEDARTVALTVSAETAASWITLQSLRQRLAIAQSDLDSAQRLSAWVRARVEAGSESQLALAQQETLVANQRAHLAALRQQAAQAEMLLALWMGQTAVQVSGLDSMSVVLTELNIPDVAPGLPSDLLTQRPDIRSAEARLRAADGNVAAARAAMFPSLMLTATAGGADGRFTHLLDNPVYSVAGGLLAPIFNAGRLAAGHEFALAQRRELLARYRQSILNGFADVQMSLDAVAGTQAQWEAQEDALAQANRAFALAEVRYREGAETVLSLLDAQRSLYATQDAAVRRQAERLLAAVGLYRALGGGWDAGE